MAQITSVGGVGFSYSAGQFGDAFSDGEHGQMGKAYGLDISMSIMVGSSTVMDVKWVCCQ